MSKYTCYVFIVQCFVLVFITYLYYLGYDWSIIPPLSSFYPTCTNCSREDANYSKPLHNGYYFIPPPYNEHPLDIIVKENICIEGDPEDANKSQIIIYNSNNTENYLQSRGFHFKNVISWKVKHKNQDIPKHFPLKNAPAFFFNENFPFNFFHYIEEGLRGLFPLLELTGRLGATEGNYIFTFLCQHASHTYYHEFLYKMSPNMTFMGCPEQPQFTNICFRHGVFGHIRRVEGDRARFVRNMKQGFGVMNTTCNQPMILILKRKERRIANLRDLVAGLEGGGLNNKVVKVADFEELSFTEQMQTIHCTSILVGVHGAGLEWLQFLQPQSAVLELGWKRFMPTELGYASMARRRALVADTFSAGENVTINWNAFMQANGKQNISESEKVLYKNRELEFISEVENPYKYADGYFNVERFVNKIKEFINELEEQHKLRF